MISVDDASYQHCGKVLSNWVKLPYSYYKLLINLKYCTSYINSLKYSSTYIHRFTLNIYK